MRGSQGAGRLALYGFVVLFLAGCNERTMVVPETAITEWPNLAGFTAAPLKAPDGVAFLETAPTLEELIAKTAPDLVWVADGHSVGQPSPIFLWTERSYDRDRRVFIIDTAFPVTKRGREFWAFINHSYSYHPYGPPEVLEFYYQAGFFREILSDPFGPRDDNNHSFVDLLSEADDGSAVFKIVYCALPVGRASQAEPIQTYIIYIGPDGKCRLASRDLGRQGSSKNGDTSHTEWIETKVVWHDPDAETPFHMTIRKAEYTGNTYENYTVSEDGQLKGPFPMTLQASGICYVEADGRFTFASLADVLGRFNRSPVLGDWAAELVRLNPDLPTGKPIPKDRRIVIRHP